MKKSLLFAVVLFGFNFAAQAGLGQVMCNATAAVQGYQKSKPGIYLVEVGSSENEMNQALADFQKACLAAGGTGILPILTLGK